MKEIKYSTMQKRIVQILDQESGIHSIWEKNGEVLYGPSADDDGNIILPDDKGRFRKINQEWLEQNQRYIFG